VEQLVAGDTLLTNSGAVQPIVWIGRRALDFTRHPDPRSARPVRVRENAIADGVPRRDLLLSPDHAILLDGLLIPAKLLVNGSTIAQDTRLRAGCYFHVELQRHAVVLAEGLGCESYLDTGNRAFFENGPDPMVLHPDFDNSAGQRRREMESCAPLAVDAGRVEPIWRQLSARAGALGPRVPQMGTTDDPGLHVMLGRRVIRPTSRESGHYAFVLPGIAETIRLVSHAAAPCDTRPWVDDRRRLGVMVKRLIVRSRADVTEIALDDPRLTDGWWPLEGHDAGLWRWTNGNALLPSCAESRVLEIHVAGTVAYLSDDRTALEHMKVTA
jgi:hypothetical protein